MRSDVVNGEESHGAPSAGAVDSEPGIDRSSSNANGSVRPLLDFRGASAAALRDILGQTDEITCAVLHARCTVVGTRLGCLWRVDPGSGDVCRLLSRGFRFYQVSLDDEGRRCAVSGADGRAIVVDTAVATPEGSPLAEPWIVEHGALPALSVALCPSYMAPDYDGHLLCTGGQDGRLVLHRRARFGGQSLVHEGEGPVSGISWRGSLVAWANDRGVKVFHARSGQKVTFVPRPEEADPAAHVCHLVWGGDHRLFIGWGLTVKIVFFVPGSANGSLSAEVRFQFACAEVVCGLGSAGPQHLTLLTANYSGTRATLVLCKYNGDVFHVADAARLRAALPSQLQLSTIAPHLPMLISAPRDLVTVDMRDFLEHSMKLLELGHYSDAIDLANGGGDGVEGLRHIVCLKCVLPDLKAERFEKACATVGRFRDLEAATWQELAVLFDRFGGLQYLAVSDVFPVPPRGTPLPRNVYDEVLHRLVACPCALVAVLHWWPPEAFSIDTLRDRLRERLPEISELKSVKEMDDQDRYRVEALARLESIAGDDLLAIRLFLLLGSPEVYDLLRRGLTSERLATVSKSAGNASKGGPVAELVFSSITRLFDVDSREACSLLADHRGVVPVDVVVKALTGCDNRWLHEYLKRLFAVDEVASADYHMQMVRLFAEYEPKGLLPFLSASERYPLKDALAVCEQRGLLEEQAYLLGRDGRVDEALQILLDKMADVRRAVLFASEYQDPKLWDVLLKYVLDHSSLLVPFLEHLDELSTLSKVGSDSGRPQPPPQATPENVLRRLPPGTPVPRIAPTIRRVIDSSALSASLYVSCQLLSSKETTTRKQGCIDAHRRAFVVSPNHRKCGICGRSLSAEPPEEFVAAASAALAQTEGLGPAVGAALIPGRGLPLPRGARQAQRGETVGPALVLHGRRGAVHKHCHDWRVALGGGSPVAGDDKVEIAAAFPNTGSFADFSVPLSHASTGRY